MEDDLRATRALDGKEFRIALWRRRRVDWHQRQHTEKATEDFYSVSSTTATAPLCDEARNARRGSYVCDFTSSSPCREIGGDLSAHATATRIRQHETSSA